MRSILLVVLLLAGAAFAQSVKILSVEPDSAVRNPDGRLLVRLFPARVLIWVENQTDKPQPGTLAPVVIGNLHTVYGLNREATVLQPHEKRLFRVYWNYPVDTVYTLPVGPVTVGGAEWGHECRVAWLDAADTVVATGSTVFAINQDGAPAEVKRPLTTQPLTDPKEAFLLRYSGYLRNPAFAPAPATDLTITGLTPDAMLKGMGPGKQLTFLLRIPALAATTPVTLALNVYSQHPQRIWQLTPDNPVGPSARRLYHRMDGNVALFEVPATAVPSMLVLESYSVHPYVAPVPVAEIAAEGEKTFGPLPPIARDDAGKPITTNVGVWRQRRAALRAAIWQALHVTPEPASTPLDPRLISEEQVPPTPYVAGVSRACIRRKVSIQVHPGERMNVWLLAPPGVGPFPAVLTMHQTVPDGKDEPVGLGGWYDVLNFGPFLVSRGYVVIAADVPRVGERPIPAGRQAYYTGDLTAKDSGYSLLGQALHDHMRVVDYLTTLPYVDAKRIGVIGHSLGGQSAGVLMAMDDRIAVGVESCGFTLMRGLDTAADLYANPDTAIVPITMRAALQAPVKERKLPWDFDDIMALWAPRPMFMHDVKMELWPNAAQIAQAAVSLQQLYASFGIPERFTVVYSNQPHCFPAWVQPAAYDWLDYWLQPDNGQ